MGTFDEGSSEKSAVILDRHPLWLDALDRLLVGVGVEVVGRATDADEAVALIEEHRRDVFVAGAEPANSEQMLCLRRALEGHSGIKSVVVADNTEQEAITAAFAAGATPAGGSCIGDPPGV